MSTTYYETVIEALAVTDASTSEADSAPRQLDDTTGVATGKVLVQGASTATLDAVTGVATGLAIAGGASAVTLADVTGVATGKVLVQGQSAVTLADVGATVASGEVTTPTRLALAQSRSNRLAFVILIEGIGIAFTDDADVTGLSAAWAGTEWAADSADWWPTAFLPSAWSQQIELFNPKIRADSVSFAVADRRDVLAKLILGANAQDARSYLTADMNNETTNVLVQETGGFTETGAFDVYIGNETIGVDSGFQGPLGWTSATRAKWSLDKTSDGVTPFAPAHRLNTINGLAPRVTDKATTWYNRRVAIYLHHYEAGTRTWSSAGQALKVWEGMLRPVRDDGKRNLVFTAVSVADLLNRQMLDQQFVADLRPGLYIPEGQNFFAAIEDTILGTVVYETTFPAGWYTWADLSATLNTLLVAATSGLKLAWSVGQSSSGRTRIQASCQPGSTIATTQIAQGGKLWARMSALAGLLLGFSVSNDKTHQDAGVTYTFGTIDVRFQSYDAGSSTAYFWHDAEAAQARYFFGYYTLTQPLQLTLTNVVGSLYPQPVLSEGESVTGSTQAYVAVGDMRIVGGTYDAGTGVFTVTELSPPQFNELGFVPREDQITLGTVLRESDVGNVQVRQVWYEKAPVGDVALRLILSTGTALYNHPTYDVNPAGMGAGVPASLVDVDAFKTLGHGGYWTLAVTGPREMGRELESMMATYGRHLVWRAGKLTLVEPRVDGPTIATAYTLDDNNKTRTDDRVASDFGIDGIINRVEFKYNRDISGSFKAQPLIAEDLVSQSDFGFVRPIVIEAWGIQNLTGDGTRDAIAQLLGRILALASRPMVTIERTISMQLIQIVPGDLVLITDPYVLDPKTGTRGVVHFPAWVISMSFDPATRSGKVKLAYSPEFPADKICPWAYSCRVKHTAPGGGYTVASGSSRYLDVEADHYKASRAGNDDTAPAAGDVVTIRELSPADAFAPLTWQRTVTSVDTAAHRIYLNDELADWDGARRYVVVPAPIAAVQRSQLANTFIADDETDSTGFNTNDSYIYGAPLPDGGAGSDTNTEDFVRPPQDGTLWAPGQPLCVADVFEAYRSVSVLGAYKTRHLAVSQVWTHNAAFTTTNGRELIVPPIWVPLYAHGARNLLVRLFGRTTDVAHSATFRVTASKTMPEGNSNVGLNVVFRDPNPGQSEIVCTSGTLAWLAEISVPCYPAQGPTPPGIWLCVEASTGNVAASAELGGISVFEDHG